MGKRKRVLSNRVKQEMADLQSYDFKLSPAEREWLQANYVDPELKQRFNEDTPPEFKRKIWREAKRTLACIDGTGRYLSFYSHPSDPADSKVPAIATSQDVKNFLRSINYLRVRSF